MLSGERIRSELLLLLAAPGAVQALRRMRDDGLIAPLLGVAGNVELLERLAAIEQALNRPADAVLRLAALASDAGDGVRERLRLSTAEAERLVQSGAPTRRLIHAPTKPPPRHSSIAMVRRRSPMVR